MENVAMVYRCALFFILRDRSGKDIVATACDPNVCSFKLCSRYIGLRCFFFLTVFPGQRYNRQQRGIIYRQNRK
jgi:hypothetical protein